MIALFTALIAPWFINWDDYKATFEAEAEKILGQPVRVHGSADASILPAPSLTFTDVKVGDTEGQPMMTVERFAVTIELMPLLQGEIRVTAMELDRPTVRVSVDDVGQVDWLLRSDASRTLDPQAVVLSGVQITDGTIIYTDAGAGAAVTLADIRATIEARSLAGPWRIDGSYATDGTPVQFTVATGVREADGSLRVRFDATPGQWPIAVSTDGVVQGGTDGPSYTGTYDLTQIVISDGNRVGDATGWRSEGSFVLTRDRLAIDQAILSEGPPDRPSSLAGSAIIELGEEARFEATMQARQLDLDRSLGAGPTQPVEVGAAANRFVEWLSGIPVPTIPGQVRFNVPGIVVGGNVIQDVKFRARPEDYGWRIEGLQARLPGQAAFQADGRLSTGEQVGFGGLVRLAVGQPATFAAWWRGRSQDGAGRLLAPFELSGRATVTPGSIAVEDMTTRIDNATVAGGFSWSRSGDSDTRSLRTDLRADRLDFIQIRALAELLGGRDLSDAAAIADSYAIKLVAGELATEDVTMRDVQIDAAFADNDLTVNGIIIGDIGGANFEVTRGQIEDVLTQPLGRLEAQLTASSLIGLARIVDRLAPDTQFSQWLMRTAPALEATTVSMTIDSFAENGAPNSQLIIRGSAGASRFDTTVELIGAPTEWRSGGVRIAGSLTSYDAVAVARQAGLDASDVEIGGARIDFEASGVPEIGLDAEGKVTFGNLKFETGGTLILPADLPPKFEGAYALEVEDAAPLLGLFGVTVPGTESGARVQIAGNVATLGASADLAWTNGQIAGQRVTGALRLAEGSAGGLKIDNGRLDLASVDLQWLASLGLGFAPAPSENSEEPWSREPFREPVYGGLAADLEVTTRRLIIDNTLDVANATLKLALEPNSVDIALESGEMIGGGVVGGLSIGNVGGNANVSGWVRLVGASLDSVIWRRAGRAVATGTLDFSTDFEATGRSPAGLISSLTGGGTLAVTDGEARYVNPRAATLVIRASDRGQQFDEDQLRELFASYIDGGSLAFSAAEAAFSIAAGTVRIQNIAVATDAAGTTGSAAIDLNTLEIDSDWTLTLESGDVEDEGPPPQVGLVFRGPIGSPERLFDVLQFNSYLNIRQEARIQQILILEEEARLERERLNRLRRKLEEDAARSEREEQLAREARQIAAANIDGLQLERGINVAAAAEVERVAWWDRMTEARTAKLAAIDEADEAAASAEAAAARAAEAEEAVDFATERAAGAAGVQTAASETLASANRDLASVEQAAAEAEQAVVDGESQLANAEEAVSQAAEAVSNADAEVASASERESTAVGQYDAAAAAAEAARNTAASARASLDGARANADELSDQADAAAEALEAVSEEAVTAAAALTVQLKVEEAAIAKRVEAETGTTTNKERAEEAEAAAQVAEATLAAAQSLAEQAEAAITTAEAELADAEREALVADDRLKNAREAWDAIAETQERIRDELARLVAEVTLAPESEPVDNTDALEVAQQALGEAEAEATEVDAALGEAELSAAEATNRVADATTALEAARTAAIQASEEADSLVAPTDAARAAAAEAKAKAQVATAMASAAGTTVESESAKTEAAQSKVATSDAAVEEAERLVAETRDRADQAASEVEAATAVAAAADEDVAQAEAAVAEAEAARAEAAAAFTSANEAATTAKARLTTAEAQRTEAETALAAARDALDSANQAVAEATVVVDEKRQAEAGALGAAEEVLAALEAARASAAEARETAASARAAAEDAAERAAALPDGWPPIERSATGRAGGTDGDSTPTDAALDSGDAARDRASERDVIPISDNPPIIPRLRPDRDTATTTVEPVPLIDVVPVLPTDARPLVITPTTAN